MRLLQRDRAITVLAVLALSALAWLDLLRRRGAGMEGEAMAWSAGSLTTAVAMWYVMMVAMMLPSALPALLIVRAQQRAQSGRWGGLTALFAAGYLLVWFAWSLAAGAAQWTLHGLMLLSPTMAVASGAAGAAVLALAGLYQFTPWKEACLTHCQSSLDFLVMQWRHGPGGALRLGTSHGLYCAGCCWALMGVLFVVGIMNLAWVALLALLVLLEKAVARGPWPSRAGGAALLLWAAYLAYVGIGGGAS